VSTAPSEYVSLHVWRVPRRKLGRVLWRVARDRGRLRRSPGVRFAKVLGTGAGRQFGAGRADPGRWAALVVWDGPASAAAFDRTPVARSWRALATAYCRIDLRPLTVRGSWSGSQPFQPTEPPTEGVVLALTRARLRPGRASVFWRAIGPVGAAADRAAGLLAAFGVGEAPIGWQGTITLWRSRRDLVEFAYRNPHHREVIARTPTQRWYAEELFARFAVLAVSGDRHVIDWAGDGAEPERTVST
jgi:hypothetical protein